MGNLIARIKQKKISYAIIEQDFDDLLNSKIYEYENDSTKNDTISIISISSKDNISH